MTTEKLYSKILLALNTGKKVSFIVDGIEECIPLKDEPIPESVLKSITSIKINKRTEKIKITKE